MYDYVIQYGFDDIPQSKIQSIKDHIKTGDVNDQYRNWQPHITIDLYQCADKDKFISAVDFVIKKLQKFELEFNVLSNFNKRVLYIEPHNKKELLEYKDMFDSTLDKFRVEQVKQRIYNPHVTLCITEMFDKALTLANQKFKPFNAEVKYIWIYNQNIELIKQYELS